MLAIHRLAYQVSRGPLFLDALVAASIEALVIELIYDVIGHRSLSEQSMKRLAEGWFDRPPLVPMREMLELGHRASAQCAFIYASTTGFRFDKAFPFFADSDQLEEAVAQTGIDLDAALLRLDTHTMNAMKVAAIETYAEYVAVIEERDNPALMVIDQTRERYIKEDEEADKEWIELGHEPLSRPQLTRVAVDLFFTAYDNPIYVPRTEIRMRTRQVVAEVALACERYLLDHGRYPASLQQLVPDYVDAAPIDSMDGNPLRYRLDPDGAAVIYSVHRNLTDEGGTTDIEDWLAVQDGDYVCRLEPQAE